jgi:hypothetical protein
MTVKEVIMKTDGDCTFTLQLMRSDGCQFVFVMLEEALYMDRAHAAFWEGEDAGTEGLGLAVSLLSVEETERLIEGLQSIVRGARS